MKAQKLEAMIQFLLSVSRRNLNTPFAEALVRGL